MLNVQLLCRSWRTETKDVKNPPPPPPHPEIVQKQKNAKTLGRFSGRKHKHVYISIWLYAYVYRCIYVYGWGLRYRKFVKQESRPYSDAKVNYLNPRYGKKKTNWACKIVCIVSVICAVCTVAFLKRFCQYVITTRPRGFPTETSVYNGFSHYKEFSH